jgi:adenosylhomocysteine nucleosidase
MIEKIEIGIIGAMKPETDGLIERMTDKKELTVGGIRFTYGRLAKKSVAVCTCGVGKVFAAMAAQAMILSFCPDYIINTGVAGTLSDKIKIGGTVVATEVVQHDMDTSALGDPVGLISGLNIVNIPCDSTLVRSLAECVDELGSPFLLGIVASGDQFICSSEKKEYIKSTFDAVACEMEGAAIGQVCYANGIGFCVLRSISDGGDEESSVDYPTFVVQAAEKSISVLLRFLEK